MRVGGKVVAIEAEGAVSVYVGDVCPMEYGTAASAACDNVPSATTAAPAAAVAEGPPVGGGGLFAKLAGLRRELSLANNVPPYVIFNDSTLREMAEKRPQDMEAFRGIGGVGKAKLEKYGDIFLAAIRGAA